jgi:hypothetical protein
MVSIVLPLVARRHLGAERVDRVDGRKWILFRIVCGKAIINGQALFADSEHRDGSGKYM